MTQDHHLRTIKDMGGGEPKDSWIPEEQWKYQQHDFPRATDQLDGILRCHWEIEIGRGPGTRGGWNVKIPLSEAENKYM